MSNCLILEICSQLIKIMIINYFRNRQTKNVNIFTLFGYTHTEPREHQKSVLPRHVVPHEAENLASWYISINWFGKI